MTSSFVVRSFWLQMAGGTPVAQVVSARVLQGDASTATWYAAEGFSVDDPIQKVVSGDERAVRVSHHGELCETPRLVFPGSFNPLHDGHRTMACVAADLLGCPAEYEISIQNVDKPDVRVADLKRRLNQFNQASVWLTRAPTFAEKAALFPRATLIVGADTVLRLDSVDYYESRHARDAAIAAVARQRCRLLVFGRVVRGRFHTLATLKLQDDVRRLCQGVPTEKFRHDVSSSALRQSSLSGDGQED